MNICPTCDTCPGCPIFRDPTPVEAIEDDLHNRHNRPKD